MESLILTLKQWQDYKFPIEECIIGGSDCKKMKGYNGSDSPQKHLIGLEPRVLKQDVQQIFNLRPSMFSRSTLCYNNLNFSGMRERRQKVEKDIKKIYFRNNGGFSTKCGKPLPLYNYFFQMKESQFVLSPEGNGEDCHRHYEAILCGAIPILQEPDNDYCQKRWGVDSEIYNKYKKLPVLFVDFYSTINITNLSFLYKQYLEKKFDFAPMFKSYWEKRSPELKTNSKFWLKHFKNTSWYE